MRATTWDPPYVHVECACNREWGIEDLYFCYQCSKILCPYCVNEEIDSFYCRNCMENMPASEANAFKNRCSRCFQCPVCYTTLQIQLHSYKGPKFYHFSCNSCYWDSISLDLKGNSLNELFVSNKEYCSKDAILTERFKALQEIYKEAYRIRRKTNIRHASVKENWTLEDLERLNRPKEITQAPSKVKSESVALHDLLSENLVYCDLTSISQRLLNISTQPRELAKCVLQPMQLLTKRSKRCKTCRKYVMKPETNPTTSNFFKMENLFVNIFPRILIREIRLGHVMLVLINPNQAVSYVKIEGIDKEIHLNAYDPVMDMVTQEEGTNDGFEREKNQVAIPVEREGRELIFELGWRFMRGADHRNINAKVKIKLGNNIA